jgi:hypothetical protein
MLVKTPITAKLKNEHGIISALTVLNAKYSVLKIFILLIYEK